MRLLDKKTGKPLDVLNIDTTEDNVFTEWILENSTNYKAVPKISVSDNIKILTPLPKSMNPKERITLGVNIDTRKSMMLTVKLEPYILEIRNI